MTTLRFDVVVRFPGIRQDFSIIDILAMRRIFCNKTILNRAQHRPCPMADVCAFGIIILGYFGMRGFIY